MSMTSSDLEKQLKRSSKRLSVHDDWLQLSLRLDLSEDDSSAADGDGDRAEGGGDAAQRFAQLEAPCNAALEVVGAKPFFGIFKTLQTQQTELRNAMDAYRQQADTASEDVASGLVDTIEAKLAVAQTTQVEARAKLVLMDEKDNLADRRIKALADRPGAPSWLTDAQADLNQAETAYNMNHSKSTSAELRVLIDDVIGALDEAEVAVKKWDAGARDVEGARTRVTAALSDMEAGDDEVQRLKNELLDAIDDYDGRIETVEVKDVDAMARRVTVALGQLTLLEFTGGGAPKGSAMRTKAMTALKTDPDLLKVIAGSAEGRKAIDEMVDGLGSSVSKATDKEFLKTALMARCGIDKLEGDLTTKALPRLYKVMKDLPAAHTIENRRLKEVERHRDSGEGASWYADATDGVVLNLERTGTFRGDTEKLNNKKVSSFDTTTLHEIGHSVDARFGFMSGHARDAAYGGWDAHSIDHVVNIAGTLKVLGGGEAFYDAFPTLPRTFLAGYLKQALLGQEAEVPVAAGASADDFRTDPAIDEAKELLRTHRKNNRVPDLIRVKLIARAMKRARIKDKAKRAMLLKIVTLILENKGGDDPVKLFLDQCQVQDTPQDVDWKALADHAAVKWCQGVRMTGENNGLWDQGRKGAQKFAVGPTVYQESYKGKWVSYAVSARATGVSNYQFRADGEWFAEIYAAYYQGLLGKGHADAAWFKTDVHERTA